MNGTSSNSDDRDINLALYDQTGALLMLDKQERRLLKELLNMTMKSRSARDWIVKKLGSEYIKVGEGLIETMGGR